MSLVTASSKPRLFILRPFFLTENSPRFHRAFCCNQEIVFANSQILFADTLPEITCSMKGTFSSRVLLSCFANLRAMTSSIRARTSLPCNNIASPQKQIYTHSFHWHPTKHGHWFSTTGKYKDLHTKSWRPTLLTKPKQPKPTRIAMRTFVSEILSM